MKNKALIIIVLNCLLIPLGAVNLKKETAVNFNPNCDVKVVINGAYLPQKESISTSFFQKKHPKYRPIKRKFRMRRSAPRCPGF